HHPANQRLPARAADTPAVQGREGRVCGGGSAADARAVGAAGNRKHGALTGAGGAFGAQVGDLAMSGDARISTGFPGHPKTKKLVRRLGPEAAWALVCLIRWTRSNRPDGDLEGMSAEDIELACDWSGDADALVRELASVGFLDGEEGAYRLHDWADHQ